MLCSSKSDAGRVSSSCVIRFDFTKCLLLYPIQAYSTRNTESSEYNTGKLKVQSETKSSQQIDFAMRISLFYVLLHAHQQHAFDCSVFLAPTLSALSARRLFRLLACSQRTALIHHYQRMAWYVPVRVQYCTSTGRFNMMRRRISFFQLTFCIQPVS
jgi:hypothetical protein